MKYVIVLVLVLIAACTPNIPTETGKEMPHIGCQEDEIDVNGNCIPAEQKNVELFGQDLEPYVETMDITGVAQGFLAKPRAPGTYPGVIMIHEWWGLNDNIKEMAKILAKEGYVVFAVDLYDGQVAKTSELAGQLAGSVRNDPDGAVMRMRNAVKYLKEAQGVDRIASLGWCFGGQQSLLLSLNVPMDATVIYYGQLTDDTEQLASLKGPVLGIFGEDDTSIPVASVESFRASLDAIGKENSVHIYPGVGHAFANPSGARYAPDETMDAWKKTLAFLEQHLKDADISSQSVPVRTIEVEGVDFKFVIDGKDNPDIIVNKGERIRIEFKSVQGFHDWVVDGYGATGKVNTGGTSSVEFTADMEGTFEYYCSVGSHRALGMKGNLIVMP